MGGDTHEQDQELGRTSAAAATCISAETKFSYATGSSTTEFAIFGIASGHFDLFACMRLLARAVHDFEEPCIVTALSSQAHHYFDHSRMTACNSIVDGLRSQRAEFWEGMPTACKRWQRRKVFQLAAVQALVVLSAQVDSETTPMATTALMVTMATTAMTALAITNFRSGFMKPRSS